MLALLNDNEIITFENDRYSDYVRQADIKYVNLNVAIKKVDSVRLCYAPLLRLPSVGASKKMMEEAC